MRRMLLAVLLAMGTLNSLASPVTVSGLEKIVAGLHAKADSQAAAQISQLQLTERLGAQQREQLKAMLPGEASRKVLIAVSDAAEFLDLPVSAIPAISAPDQAAQAAMIARTRSYVERTIPMLPNLFATQDTLQFSDSVKGQPRPDSTKPQNRKLQLVGTTRATIRYLGGREELEASRTRDKGPASSSEQPLAEGVFALAYGVVLSDALSGSPAWSHWENSQSGTMAVFHYDVPAGKSHYRVPVPGEEGLHLYQNAYGGELAIDPASGAILRLTLIAVRGPTTPVAKANILIEYGPVDIGGRAYICPIHSVALSLSRSLDPQMDIYKFSTPVGSVYRLKLNDVVYGQYHLFRSNMLVMPGDDTPPAVQPQSPPPASPSQNAPHP